MFGGDEDPSVSIDDVIAALQCSDWQGVRCVVLNFSNSADVCDRVRRELECGISAVVGWEGEPSAVHRLIMVRGLELVSTNMSMCWHDAGVVCVADGVFSCDVLPAGAR